MYRISILTQELLAAGLPVVGIAAVGEAADGLAAAVRIDWEAEPTPEQLAQAAVLLAAHDPRDRVGEDGQDARRNLRDDITAILADFQQALDRWDTLTAAQQKAVLRRCVIVLGYLLRYIRTQL